MSEIPSATVENARRPLYHRAGFRRLVGVAIIVVACVVGWRLFKRLIRTDSAKQLAVRQDAARAKIGDSFDDLFDNLLDADTTEVSFDVKLDVSSKLGEGYGDASSCAKGFDDAFQEALGAGVVTFSVGGYLRSPVEATLTAAVTPHGAGFQLANSPKVYSGVALAGDVHFLGKDIHVDVVPAEDLEFSHMVFQFDLMNRGPSEAEVAGGILQGACKQVALSVIESLTTWKRPPPPAKRDPEKDCEQGFHCRENAELLEATEPAKAAKLYQKACDHDDAEACSRAADLGVASTKPGRDEATRNLQFALEMTCRTRQLATACEGAGRLALADHEAGQPPTSYVRHEALLAFLRGCDLGVTDACTEAAPLVKGTPFAETAPLLAGHKTTVASNKLGTLFALKWGQWHHMDSGQPTMWSATKPPAPPDGAIVEEFSGDKIPKAIHPPGRATTVYAIALERGHGEYDTQCTVCMPSSRPDNSFMMSSIDCVCVLDQPAPHGR